MRDAFISRLTEHAARDPRVNLIVGDLGFNVIDDFADRFPNQFLNAGVAEQSMIGIAAGMASTGKKVFVYSIANFPTMRCLEQIRNDICYHNLDVTIVSVGAGLAYGSLGYSHHAVEDLGVMRTLPGLSIYSPADPCEVIAAVDEIAMTHGPSYLRLGKNREPILHVTPIDSEMFSHGSPLLLRPGNDVTLLATGGIAALALDVAELAAGQFDVSIRVLSVPKVAPLNVEAILDSSLGTLGIVTLEEHTISGGFGSLILENLALRQSRIPVLPIGLNRDGMRAVGSQQYLRDASGLSIESVTEQIVGFAGARS